MISFQRQRQRYLKDLCYRQKYRIISKSLKNVTTKSKPNESNSIISTCNDENLYNHDSCTQIHIDDDILSSDLTKDSISKNYSTPHCFTHQSENAFLSNNNFSLSNETVEQNSNNLKDDLRCCFSKHNISQTAITDILKILVDHGYKELPTDARSLMKTQRNTINQIEVSNGGQYAHLGIEDSIIKAVKYYFKICPEEILLDVNIDGLPLSKTSSSQFWPILAAIRTDVHMPPFPIGIYHGPHKPLDSNLYLERFVYEMKHLMNNGLNYDDHVIKVGINAIICDAPARAFICGIKGHTGYFGCSKCITEGDFVDNRVVFPEIDSELRTNLSFRNRQQPEHHKYDTILEQLNINLIAQIPLDPMHLVYLGVMKRLLQFWVHGKMNVRINKQKFQEVELKIQVLKKFIPKEFARLPRSLSEIDRWKATEFRLFLLYTGIVILKGCLPEVMYNHFLSLSISLRILSNKKLSPHLIDYADKNLRYFVEKYGILYGTQYISYNVHSLIHLCNDVRKFGPVQNFSAFKFENYMYHIKKKLKMSGKPFQQILNRISEENNLIDSSFQKDKKSYPQAHFSNNILKFIVFSDFVISCESPNNCCILENGKIALVEDIFIENAKIFMNYKYFTKSGNLFSIPCDSSLMGIHTVQLDNLSHNLLTSEVNFIIHKCLKFTSFESDTMFIIMHLLHSSLKD